MNNIKKEYINSFKFLINNKAFLIIIILVTILSFGFTIVNSSIGVDDTCLDRYYSGASEYSNTNMLTSDRWGAFILYHLLGITEFTPFWLELICAIIIMITAIVICAFIRKNFENSINGIIPYIVFASVYISYPLINEAFIYQASNLAVILGNLAIIICTIILYENFQNANKKYIYILVFLVLPLFISMYEAIVQTFILAISTMALLIGYKNNKIKQSLKFFIISISILALAVLLNIIINNTIHMLGVPRIDAAEKDIFWSKINIFDGIQNTIIYILDAMKNFKYLPVGIFTISILIALVIAIYESYNKNNVMILLYSLAMILANFSLCILQCSIVLYRTCISWGLFVAIVICFIYLNISKKAICKIAYLTFIILLVLHQTRDLNQWFYNDYVRYERDLNIAYQLIYELESKYDIRKPLVVMGTPKKGLTRTNLKTGNQVNSLSVLWWGQKAFDDNGREFIKFLNSLGYSFKIPNDEQYNLGLKIKDSMADYPKEGSIIELDNCIVINF